MKKRIISHISARIDTHRFRLPILSIDGLSKSWHFLFHPKTAIALTALFLFTACQKETLEIPPGEERVKVEFHTETVDDFTTRSAGFTSSGSNIVTSMGIYASFTADRWEDDPAKPLNFMTDQSVERNGANTPWQYTPELFWPTEGNISFFAYAPHRNNSVWKGNTPQISGNKGIPTIEYTIASNHADQVDLLIATPVKNQTKRDYVTIPLRHALTKIGFSARVANDPGSGVTYRVTSVQLTRLYNSGTVTMDGENRKWTPSGNFSSYTQTIGNNGLKDLFLSSTYQSITPDGGHLFLLPQTLVMNSNDTAKVIVSYEITSGGNTEERTKSLTLPLAIAQWRAGEAYNLLFTIDNGVSFIVAPTPWNQSEVQVDIQNRILNVTRIEANVYEGAITRIFFWSNQPKDSVYVRPDGNLDQAKYPTGESFRVDSVFQQLSGARATRLYYPGFDGLTTQSGEGYIDVIHTLEAKTDASRHIYLNASGLSRSIRLNSIFRGNQTSTPYVGTFHRWNETGERIITWNYTQNWTASVLLDHPGSNDVLIDQQVSPFMTSGQLYGTGHVGDPESAQLKPDAVGPINGYGRIYFRVGWKTRLSSRTSLPRYARIRVTGTDIGGAGINEVILYLRQGEADDYLFPFDETSRAASVKWSPYNLTVEGLAYGNSIQIDNERANVRFTQYPSQAGAFFKWVNPILTNRPTAYPPVGAISGWTVPYYEGFWSPVMSQQESCPPGYRRPNRGSISTSVARGTQVSAELLHSLFATFNYEDYEVNTSANAPSNSVWGYYADGFFDRRKITDAVSVDMTDTGTDCAVDATSVTVGYMGRLFFNPSGNRQSLFFPGAGYRSDQKQHKDGAGGYYWSSSGFSDRGETFGWNLITGPSTASTATSALYGMTVRCVRDIGFSTTLPDYNETVVPVALGYSANGSVIDKAFIEKWNVTVLNDIGSLSSGAYTVKAKVTFSGNVPSGIQSVVTTTLLGSNRIAPGSTITYDFSGSGIVWSPGAQIAIGVENDTWEYKVNTGSFINGSSTAAANLYGTGVIVLQKK